VCGTGTLARELVATRARTSAGQARLCASLWLQWAASLRTSSYNTVGHLLARKRACVRARGHKGAHRRETRASGHSGPHACSRASALVRELVATRARASARQEHLCASLGLQWAMSLRLCVRQARLCASSWPQRPTRARASAGQVRLCASLWLQCATSSSRTRGHSVGARQRACARARGDKGAHKREISALVRELLATMATSFRWWARQARLRASSHKRRTNALLRKLVATMGHKLAHKWTSGYSGPRARAQARLCVSAWPQGRAQAPNKRARVCGYI